MNKKVLLVSGTMAALMGIVTISHAAGDQNSDKKANQKAKMLEKYDADGDGVLSDDEKAVMKEQRGRKGQKGEQGGGKGKKGADKDEAAGENPRENGRGKGANGGRNPEGMMKRFDTDGDGQLSDEEKTAMREEMKNRAGGRNREEMMKRFDTDGDGELNDEEREALRAEMSKRQGRRDGGPEGKGPSEGRPEGGRGGGNGRPSYEEILAKYDADGDGKLNGEERKAAREGSKKKKDAPSAE